MGYVTVKEESGEVLRLAREPSVRAWAICVGLISLGFGAAYYSADYLIWKLTYICGSVFVALSFMEDWEECVLDKSSGEVRVTTESLVYKLFKGHGQKIVSGDLGEVVGVSVEEQQVRYGGTSYTVVLRFSEGYSFGVTETATMGDRSEHQLIADKIYNFLELDKKPSSSSFAAPDPFEVDKDDIALDTDGASTDEDLQDRALDDEDSVHSDESFERIDKSDIPENLSQEAEPATSCSQNEASMQQEVTSTSEAKTE